MADTNVDIHDLSVSLTRIFDAPPALVYRAWTDPELMAQWWGPMQSRSTVDMDVREGGAYRLVMNGPGGEAYPMSGHFTEVQENRVIEFTATVEGHDPAWKQQMLDNYLAAGGVEGTEPALQVMTRVVLEPFPENRTRQIVTQTYRTEAERDAFVKMGAAGGWGMSFDKLDTLLMK